VSLFNLFTAWNTTFAIKAAKLDALTWLDYDVGSASFVSSGDTYTIAGTYDPTFEPTVGCYATSLPDNYLPPGASGLPVQPATVGGGCFPAEVTVTVASFADSAPDDADFAEPSLGIVVGMAGDYVLPANLSPSNPCGQISYSYQGGGVFLENTQVQVVAWNTDRQCDGTEVGQGSFNFQAAYRNSDNLVASATASGIIAFPAGSGPEGSRLVGGDYFRGFDVYFTGSMSKADGGPLTQCSGVGFTPTTITVPLTRQPSFTYGRPDSPNDVVATGPWMPCGYKRSLWNWLLGDSQLGTETQSGGLPASEIVVLPENDDSEPATHIVRLTSEGSSPTDITVTVPGRCGTIATSSTAFSKITGTVNTWRQNPLEPMRCVTIPVITGRTCAWTAVASGNIAIEEGTATGTGTGSVKAIRDSEGRLSGTITITLDNPIPSDSWRYSYSPLIIQIG
jgi:hypothetical protein